MTLAFPPTILTAKPGGRGFELRPVPGNSLQPRDVGPDDVVAGLWRFHDDLVEAARDAGDDYQKLLSLVGEPYPFSGHHSDTRPVVAIFDEGSLGRLTRIPRVHITAKYLDLLQHLGSHTSAQAAMLHGGANDRSPDSYYELFLGTRASDGATHITGARLEFLPTLVGPEEINFYLEVCTLLQGVAHYLGIGGARYKVAKTPDDAAYSPVAGGYARDLTRLQIGGGPEHRKVESGLGTKVEISTKITWEQLYAATGTSDPEACLRVIYTRLRPHSPLRDIPQSKQQDIGYISPLWEGGTLKLDRVWENTRTTDGRLARFFVEVTKRAGEDKPTLTVWSDGVERTQTNDLSQVGFDAGAVAFFESLVS